MGIKERKDRHQIEVRCKILDAAEELFLNEGFDQVSMRKIAGKIEYSTTTIYRFFKNKSEIMAQLIDQGYVAVYRRYEDIISQNDASPLETLKQIIRSYIDFSITHSKHYRLWFDTSDICEVDGHLRMSHGESSYQVYQTWIDLIESCQKQNLLSGTIPMELFQVIWTSVHGLILLRIHYPSFPWIPVTEHIEQVISMIDRGFCPSGESQAKNLSTPDRLK